MGTPRRPPRKPARESKDVVLVAIVIVLLSLMFGITATFTIGGRPEAPTARIFLIALALPLTIGVVALRNRSRRY